MPSSKSAEYTISCLDQIGISSISFPPKSPPQEGGGVCLLHPMSTSLRQRPYLTSARLQTEWDTKNKGSTLGNEALLCTVHDALAGALPWTSCWIWKDKKLHRLCLCSGVVLQLSNQGRLRGWDKRPNVYLVLVYNTLLLCMDYKMHFVIMQFYEMNILHDLIKYASYYLRGFKVKAWFRVGI